MAASKPPDAAAIVAAFERSGFICPPEVASSLRLSEALAKPLLLAGFGLAAGFLAPYFYVIDQRVAADFAALTWQVPTRVMARPLRPTRW